MNKFKYYFILLVATISLFSCSKNDTPTAEPLRDYSVQYATDIATIEEYLQTYYITVTNNPGATDDQDVVFTKIPTGGTQASIWSYKDNTGFPKLLSRDVSLHDITYKLYYLVLREGSGQTPCNVDAVMASYKGDYLDRVTADNVTTLTATSFEEVKFPQSFFNLNGTIIGWSEIFPQFKTGTYTANADGTVSHTDFGAGIMFIPSGLAYYASDSSTIPSYSPLVFSFKLYEIQRLDQDNDGIPSYLEDLDFDGYIYDYRNTINYPTTPAVNKDDTDSDSIPDFLDVDDDGDKYTTLLERKYTDSNGVTQYYDFASIPLCTGGNGKKRYLDATCHD
jgi:hypothetical protein